MRIHTDCYWVRIREHAWGAAFRLCPSIEANCRPFLSPPHFPYLLSLPTLSSPPLPVPLTHLWSEGTSRGGGDVGDFEGRGRVDYIDEPGDLGGRGVGACSLRGLQGADRGQDTAGEIWG